MRTDVVPVVDVQACRICFATCCKLYPIAAYNILYKTYQLLTGLLIEKDVNLPSHLCSVCARRLLNCARFRTASLRAHMVLRETIKTHGCITLELIQSVKESQSSLNACQTDMDNQSYNSLEFELKNNENMFTNEQTDDGSCSQKYIPIDCVKIEYESEDINNTEDVNNTLTKPPERVNVNIKVEIVNDQDILTEDGTSVHIDTSTVTVDCIKTEDDFAMNQDSANEDSNHADADDCDAFVGEDYSSCDNIPSASVRQPGQSNCTGEPTDSTCNPEASCEYPYKSISDLQMNYLKGHTGDTYSCNMCNYTTMKKHTLRRHYKTHSSVKPHVCHVCNKSFIRKDHLTNHLIVHSGIKPYLCSVCNKTFKQKSSFTVHLTTHSNERPYSCNVCSKTFNRKDRFTKHLKIHAGERPYSCNVCDKTFTYQNVLREHLRTHSGEKPYTCNVCFKAFAAQTALRGHLRTHSGEKPYACNMCDKAFCQKNNLTAHLRIHTGVKPFTCEICKKSFKRKEEIIKHMRIHSGEKPYSCSVCNKAFNQKSNLNRHMRRHTEKKPSS